jgi:hypothetical protein
VVVGGGGGGLVSGLRTRVKSLVGSGRQRQSESSPLFSYITWGIFALVVVLLITRRGC